MKKIILSIFAIFLGFMVFAPLSLAMDSVVSDISKMEENIWGFTYSKDDNQKRLSRIESNVFGKINSQLSEKERIKKLNEALGIESYEESQKPVYEIAQQEAEDINYPQIDLLETQIFAQNYKKENIYKRLERLEKKLFGSVQDGNLAMRTDRLKAYIKKDEIASRPNPNQYTQQPYRTTDAQSYMNSQNRYDADTQIQIAGLENALFSKTYSQDPIGLRLNRLERKIFQRDFSSDDEYMRLQRLQAAANAQQTAKLYEANKVQKYASTGIQIGSIILMILALIL